MATRRGWWRRPTARRARRATRAQRRPRRRLRAAPGLSPVHPAKPGASPAPAARCKPRMAKPPATPAPLAITASRALPPRYLARRVPTRMPPTSRASASAPMPSPATTRRRAAPSRRRAAPVRWRPTRAWDRAASVMPARTRTLRSRRPAACVVWVPTAPRGRRRRCLVPREGTAAPLASGRLMRASPARSARHAGPVHINRPFVILVCTRTRLERQRANFVSRARTSPTTTRPAAASAAKASSAARPARRRRCSGLPPSPGRTAVPDPPDQAQPLPHTSMPPAAPLARSAMQPACVARTSARACQQATTHQRGASSPWSALHGASVQAEAHRARAASQS